jgi:hypothetical protein
MDFSKYTLPESKPSKELFTKISFVSLDPNAPASLTSLQQISFASLVSDFDKNWCADISLQKQEKDQIIRFLSKDPSVALTKICNVFTAQELSYKHFLDEKAFKTATDDFYATRKNIRDQFFLDLLVEFDILTHPMAPSICKMAQDDGRNTFPEIYERASELVDLLKGTKEHTMNLRSIAIQYLEGQKEEKNLKISKSGINAMIKSIKECEIGKDGESNIYYLFANAIQEFEGVDRETSFLKVRKYSSWECWGSAFSDGFSDE